MRITWRHVITLLWIVVLGASLTSAQETDETMFAEEQVPLFSELTAVSVPQDWDYEYDDESGTLFMYNDEIIIQIFDALASDSNLDVDLEMPLDKAFVSVYSDLFAIEIDADDITILETDPETDTEVEVARFEYSEDNYTYLARNAEYDMLFMLEVYHREEDSLEDVDLDVVDAVIATVRPVDLDEDVETSECVLTVSEPDTVRLRVGPGTNRTAVSFLAVGDYQPIGQASADDESQWFRLDKEIAAPESSANEVWVASDAVDVSEGCDDISLVDAPALIPVAPSNTDAGASGDSPEAINVESDEYTLTYGNANGSCVESDNISFEASELGFETITVPVSMSGNQLIVNGVVLSQQSNGQYVGTSNSDSGESLRLYLTQTSPTSLSGQIVFDAPVEGAGRCSITIAVTVTR